MSETLTMLIQEFEKNCNMADKCSAETKKATKELMETLNKEKSANDQVMEKFKKYKPIDTKIVKLNVGGTTFSTLKSTLVKKIKDESGDFLSTKHI